MINNIYFMSADIEPTPVLLWWSFMKSIKNFFVLIFSAVLIIFSGVTVSASTSDEAVISAQDNKYTPLYTTSPDSSFKNYTSGNMSSGNYRLFYTQTTFLALIAGYLILFKVKGIKREDRHRR